MKAAHRTARSFEVTRQADGLRVTFLEEGRVLELAVDEVMPANAECLFVRGGEVLELDFQTLALLPARRLKVAHVLDHEPLNPAQTALLRHWLGAQP